MKSLSKREKILVIAMLSIAIFYAYYKLFLSPAISEIMHLKSVVSSYNNQLQQLRLTSDSNKKLDTQLQEKEKKFEESTKVLPQSAREPEVAYNLKAMADGSKVKVDNISFGQPASSAATQQSNGQNNNTNSQTGVMTLPVTLLVTGDYNSIISFTSSIESGGRLAEIETLNISQGSSLLQANINVNFYYVNGTESNSDKFDFNHGTYGKDNLFK